ncbi:LLM class flavin-dependent oxidoreductase [Jiangella mangrovi]|uniref:Alkanesulfonate monooxygenase SsuD/methylene tetrahydromethanopterin reductase-like flavin-dependent oxidoreductase (Luciferase family) n=1 Tax=Jiangella mangrovi TaxID=1524084 RepID=A0A7W9LJT3_9ACTN|nr:LLM class flavin-dependent oxidoreductase [Jiangella mangrovi]MBB5786372.1 alkanesulfonate monooxygenase SsuD/methylene tetrahydromethanopterin reductase-like flavin-dependent oxidoreductase (luciferase family) [Jiangella mangrovi]
MEFGIFLPVGFGGEFGADGDPVEAAERVIQLTQTAEECGFAAAWLPDHLQTIPPSPSHLFESWAMLTALARHTDRIRIGPLVSSNSYRNPALQAKIASTVDVLSHGRLTLGLGAGWYQPDYDTFGYEFADAPTRLASLRDGVRTITEMWLHPTTAPQRPHIPIMIAGGGERVTLKIVAEYAEACNVMVSPQEAARKFAILRDHCRTLNRDYGTILRTATTGCLIAATDEEAQAALSPAMGAFYPGDFADYLLYGSVDTVKNRIAAYEQAGVQQLIVGFHEATDPEAIRRFAKEFIG